MWKRVVEWVDWADRSSFIWGVTPTTIKTLVAALLAAIFGPETGRIEAGLIAALIVLAVTALPKMLRRPKRSANVVLSGTGTTTARTAHVSRRWPWNKPKAYARGWGDGKPDSEKDCLDRLFRAEIDQMSFRGLWKDDLSHSTYENNEPFLRFNLILYNDSALKICINGCDGEATIDGDICTLPARLEPGRMWLNPWTSGTASIKQPLLTEKGRELIESVATQSQIRISLGSIVMHVDGGDDFPTRPIPVGVAFEVDPTGVTARNDGLTKVPLMLRRQ